MALGAAKDGSNLRLVLRATAAMLGFGVASLGLSIALNAYSHPGTGSSRDPLTLF